jgi:hypothetical protein
LAGLVAAGLAAAKVLAVEVFLGVSYLYNRTGQAGLGDRDRRP